MTLSTLILNTLETTLFCEWNLSFKENDRFKYIISINVTLC